MTNRVATQAKVSNLHVSEHEEYTMLKKKKKKKETLN